MAARQTAGGGSCPRRSRSCSYAHGFRSPGADLARHSQRAVDAVLVEAPSPVGAAVVRAITPADLRVARLRRDARGSVDGVRIGDRADDPLGVDLGSAIERDAELLLSAKRLQSVHVVGHRAAPTRIGAEMV